MSKKGVIIVLMTALNLSGLSAGNSAGDGVKSPKQIAEALFHKGWYDRFHNNSFSLPLTRVLPLLTPELGSLAGEWYKAREHLLSIGPWPDGNYDPILQSYWLVNMVKVDNSIERGDEATVDVHIRRSEQGMTGTETSRCEFNKINGRWFLNDIIFDRNMLEPSRNITIVKHMILSDQLRTDIRRFAADFNASQLSKKILQESSQGRSIGTGKGGVSY